MNARTAKPGPYEALSHDFHEHAAWLKRQLRRRHGGTTPDADDIVQEAYIRFGCYDRDARNKHPRALLWRIARNLIFDEMRRARRAGAIAIALDRPETYNDAQFTTPADQAETVLLKQLIVALPAHIREVFILARFSAMTNAEIARHLGVSVKTVEWRMARAMTLCAARLREDDD